MSRKTGHFPPSFATESDSERRIRLVFTPETRLRVAFHSVFSSENPPRSRFPHRFRFRKPARSRLSPPFSIPKLDAESLEEPFLIAKIGPESLDTTMASAPWPTGSELAHAESIVGPMEGFLSGHLSHELLPDWPFVDQVVREFRSARGSRKGTPWGSPCVLTWPQDVVVSRSRRRAESESNSNHRSLRNFVQPETIARAWQRSAREWRSGIGPTKCGQKLP